ncbi:MAG: DUF3781 domain-containing protein [Fibrobacterales bacterium]
MIIDKAAIVKSHCYTELVYGRINKKLGTAFSKKQIERLMLTVLQESGLECFVKKGKNYYISSATHNMRITINSYTFRIITVDRYSITSVPS